ncbi:MAG: class I SAM-dependent methyltransferase [Brevinematales bacterium]
MALHKLREYYLPFLSFPEEYAKLDWEDEYSHHKRFAVLCELVNLRKKKLLDVGCGLGSLYRYLKRLGIDCEYTGIDVLPEMIDLARKYSPDGNFLCGDPFERDGFDPQSFDVVYASGIFNLDVGKGKSFLFEAIPQMEKWAKEALVFNALHCRSHCQEAPYVYYDPQEVLFFLRARYSFKITLVDDYLINDFTILMEKTPRFR